MAERTARRTGKRKASATTATTSTRKAVGGPNAGATRKAAGGPKAGATRKAAGGSKAAATRRASGGAGQESTRKPAGGSRPRHGANGGGSALETVTAARERLQALLGRPVEAVLGVDRDRGNWIVKVQVVELARIPNTTDVLGEYEAVLDRKGEVLRYSRTARFHRGQVDATG